MPFSYHARPCAHGAGALLVARFQPLTQRPIRQQQACLGRAQLKSEPEPECNAEQFAPACSSTTPPAASHLRPADHPAHTSTTAPSLFFLCPAPTPVPACHHHVSCFLPSLDAAALRPTAPATGNTHDLHGQLRSLCAHWPSPVDPFEQHRKLCRRHNVSLR
jgi:hypothetical protein